MNCIAPGQVGRVRAMGPDGNNPRLTRLNTAGGRALLTKAEKSAKKLAFDLVDIYTRAFGAGLCVLLDTAQGGDRSNFQYQLITPDQKARCRRAMKRRKPMDRFALRRRGL